MFEKIFFQIKTESYLKQKFPFGQHGIGQFLILGWLKTFS